MVSRNSFSLDLCRGEIVELLGLYPSARSILFSIVHAPEQPGPRLRSTLGACTQRDLFSPLYGLQPSYTEIPLLCTSSLAHGQSDFDRLLPRIQTEIRTTEVSAPYIAYSSHILWFLSYRSHGLRLSIYVPV